MRGRQERGDGANVSGDVPATERSENAMNTAPEYLQDAGTLLGDDGFTTSKRWYHGTSSALVASILAEGLKRSGDQQQADAAQRTMATIGGRYQAASEPVFLTPSAELAWFWAQQTVTRRNVRVGGDNQPVVIAVTLPDEINKKVRPDVGAASLLMLDEGKEYMGYLAAIYQRHGRGTPDIDLRAAKREEYLSTLGMAYLDADIDTAHLNVLAG